MQDLPISEKEDLIIGTLLENQVIVIEGETGSGKTTQLPIFLYEAGFAQQGTIGITQPRRFAATSVAQYVASLSGKPLGDIVGYQVRFDRASDRRTAIKFMTAGILLRELLMDPLLSAYSVIMVDEAHERTEEMDLLLGLLKGVLERRKNLRLIVASATIDTAKFSSYFNSAPVIKVSGRMYPVEVRYLDCDVEDLDRLLELSAQKVAEVHSSTLSGHMLVFVPGKQDAHQLVDIISRCRIKDLLPLPLYGGMDPVEQEKVFLEYPGKRKVVVCTNIAETSVTIDGVSCVIDTGLIKESDFNSENSLSGLDTIEHSRAGCDQRKGRAGRTCPGVCHRMYTEANFSKRRAFTKPEIQRGNLNSTLLTMAALGIPDPASFRFIDQPDPRTLKLAGENLVLLGAFDQRRKLTRLGLQMALLPLNPAVTKMLLEARSFGCVEEMMTVASFLTISNIFLRPKGLESKADEMHQGFRDEKSDLLTFLKVWSAYESSGFSWGWCRKYFLNHRALWEVQALRGQLRDKLRSVGIKLTSHGDPSGIIKCAFSALRYSLLEHRPGKGYCSLFQNVEHVAIHPSSSLRGVKARFIFAIDLLCTTRTYAQNCSVVHTDWLGELLPHLFRPGQIINVRHTPGDLSATGEQVILFRGVPIGTRTIPVPIKQGELASAV